MEKSQEGREDQRATALRRVLDALVRPLVGHATAHHLTCPSPHIVACPPQRREKLDTSPPPNKVDCAVPGLSYCTVIQDLLFVTVSGEMTSGWGAALSCSRLSGARGVAQLACGAVEAGAAAALHPAWRGLHGSP